MALYKLSFHCWNSRTDAPPADVILYVYGMSPSDALSYVKTIHVSTNGKAWRSGDKRPEGAASGGFSYPEWECRRRQRVADRGDGYLRAGDLAYYDAFRTGLVPVEVAEIPTAERRGVSVDVMRSVGAYFRGERLTVAPSAVVLRTSRVRDGKIIVREPKGFLAHE